MSFEERVASLGSSVGVRLESSKYRDSEGVDALMEETAEQPMDAEEQFGNAKVKFEDGKAAFESARERRRRRKRREAERRRPVPVAA